MNLHVLLPGPRRSAGWVLHHALQLSQNSNRPVTLYQVLRVFPRVQWESGFVRTVAFLEFYNPIVQRLSFLLRYRIEECHPLLRLSWKCSHCG